MHVRFQLRTVDSVKIIDGPLLTCFSVRVCIVSVSSVTVFFCSIVHIVSALEHPSSAVRRGVIARTITPARGPPAPFRTSGGALSCAQSTLNWPSANVRTVFIIWSYKKVPDKLSDSKPFELTAIEKSKGDFE